jgi:L-ribulose-5-phosphate 3-epimerase
MGSFFYNSNGFAFHRIDDAARILADLGYDGLALTPDVHHLDPFHTKPAALDAFRVLLEDLGLRLVLETGARFVLDPQRKHRPTLLDAPEEAEVRVSFLMRCVDMAARLGAPIVTIWSGNGPAGTPDAVLAERLDGGLRRLCDHAARRGVRIGFEPEPGMWIETAAQYADVRSRLQHEAFGLTLDVGHCLATGEGEPADVIRAFGDELLVVQLDDHRAGIHDHLAFGEGEVDFLAVAAALGAVRFQGPLEVELSRHSATAPATARESLGFLQTAFRA